MKEHFELHIAETPKTLAKKGSFIKYGRKKYLNSFEVKEIINLYHDKFNYELAKEFDVSESAIYNVKRKYNLSKSEQIMDAKRFHKNHIPFNKNKPHPIKNSGQFSKGDIPLNHKPVSSLRISKDGYHEVKISEPAKWDFLHRIVWRRHYGEIPEGMIVIFRDGVKSNIDISNLELISRKENLRRNHNRTKFAKTMKALWRIEKLRSFYGMPRKTNLRIRTD